MHGRRLLCVGRNETLRDCILHLLLDKRRHCRRERACDVIRDIGTQKETLDFIREILKGL